MANYKIYSDESGAWMDETDVYVRSWLCIDEENEKKLINLIEEIKTETGCTEVKWRTVASLGLSERINSLDFKVFISVTEVGSISDDKYLLTRSYKERIEAFDFGDLRAETIEKIKSKIYLDIRYVLFLSIYESLHLKSAQEIFSNKFPGMTFEYVVDPPQMLNKDWAKICEELTGYKPSFPSSEREPGVQFTDVIAGAWRSFIIRDKRVDSAKNFICECLMPSKMLFVNGCPNPNLIVYSESSPSVRERCTVSVCKK